MKKIVLATALLFGYWMMSAQPSQQPADVVNVFLGTSGDHGQLSPAASYPFSYTSILPQTYPSTHTGYEYYAKKYLGFAHTVFEGVGCRGSGGNILIKPFTGKDPSADELIRVSQDAAAGYYVVIFENKISAAFTVAEKYGIHRYSFPKGDKGLALNLRHSLSNGFSAAEYTLTKEGIEGWTEAGTTCGAGRYKLYFVITTNKNITWQETEKYKLQAVWNSAVAEVVELRIGLSSVSTDYARQSIKKDAFDKVRANAREAWNNELGKIKVTGNKEEAALFYSLLYRVIQSPYNVSEADGTYRANDGSLQKKERPFYSGWSVWDNYKTQLPLISVLYPERFNAISQSLAELYLYGKKDYATRTEPANSVRTEHAIVVLLDAYRKGVPIDFAAIINELKKEVDALDYSKPDKALESSYDAWALSEIYGILKNNEQQELYRKKALEYRTYWDKDFKDLTKRDVDQMQARGLYQGTIWQYRWFVPFDVKGLIKLVGGEEQFVKELKAFFDRDLYNQANEPDIHAPSMFNATASPWLSQYWMRQIAGDTINQWYFNDNSKGIDPYVGRVYKNIPKALLRTMDDDGGAMSGWYVFAAAGLYPAAVGWPVYYINVPLFPELSITQPGNKKFTVKVKNFNKQHPYIQHITFNGKPYNKLYITQEEIQKGGEMIITAGSKPSEDWGITDRWLTSFE